MSTPDAAPDLPAFMQAVLSFLDDSKIAYTRKEAAAAVGVSEKEIERATQAEELPAKKRGTRVLVEKAALYRWFSGLPDYEPPRGSRP